MIRRPRQRTYSPVVDINITNLVDVVLVLLIIFMISAPLLQSGIEVELPKTKAAAMEEESEGIVITIDKRGGVYINDVWARMDKFEEALESEFKAKGTRSVFLRGDSAVTYGTAISLIGRLKEMGIDAIGLVTAHEEKSGRGK